MTKQMQKLYAEANQARSNLLRGLITYDEALKVVNRYLEAANKKGREIAKKHGMKFRPFNPYAFMR